MFFFALRVLFLVFLSSSALMWGACVSNVLHDIDTSTSSTRSYIRMVYCLPTLNGSATLPGIYIRQVLVREMTPSRSATVVYSEASKNDGYMPTWSDSAQMVADPEYFVDYGDQPCISAFGTAIAYRQVQAPASSEDYLLNSSTQSYIVWQPLSGTIGWLTGAGTAQYLWYGTQENSSGPSHGSGTIRSRNPALSQDGTILAYSGYNSSLQRFCIYKATGSLTSLPTRNLPASLTAPFPANVNLSSQNTLQVYAWNMPSTTRGWDGSEGDRENCWKFRSPTAETNIGDADAPSVYSVTAAGVTTHYIAFSCELLNAERWCQTPTNANTVMRMEQDPPFGFANNAYMKSYYKNAWSVDGSVDFSTKADGFYCLNLEARDPSIFVSKSSDNKAYEVSLTSMVMVGTDGKSYHRLHANTGRAIQPCLAYDAARDELNVSYASSARLYYYNMVYNTFRGETVYCGAPVPSPCFQATGGGADIFLRRLPGGNLNMVTKTGVPFTNTLEDGQDTQDGLRSETDAPSAVNLGRLITRLTKYPSGEFTGAEIGIDTKTYAGGTSATAAALLCLGPLPSEGEVYSTVTTGNVTNILASGVFTTSVASKAVVGYALRVTGTTNPINANTWTITAVNASANTVTVDISKQTPIAETPPAAAAAVLLVPMGRSKEFLRSGLYAAPVVLERGLVAECSAKSVKTQTSDERWIFLGKTGFVKGNWWGASFFYSLVRTGATMELLAKTYYSAGDLRLSFLSEPFDFQKNTYAVELEKNNVYMATYATTGTKLEKAILALTSRDLDDGKADKPADSFKIPLSGDKDPGSNLWTSYYVRDYVLAMRAPEALEGDLDGVLNGMPKEPSNTGIQFNWSGLWDDKGIGTGEFVAPFAVWFWKKALNVNDEVRASLTGNSRPLSLASDGRFAIVLSPSNGAYGIPLATKGDVTVSLLILNPLGPCDP